MGSATTQALGAVKSALDETPGVTLDVARELFGAARTVAGSSQLRSALGNGAASSESRRKVVTDVFGAVVGATTVALLGVIVGERWSSDADLVDAIDETAVRAASIGAGSTDLEGELFAFARTVAGNPELELALGSRIGDESAKGDLVRSLLAGRADEATILITASLAQQLRGRRVRPVLARAERIVADQRGRTVATVIAASPLGDAQAERLRTSLSARYGRSITLNTVIDASVIGGVRVQIADDVIDASVSSRLADLRHRLAG